MEVDETDDEEDTDIDLLIAADQLPPPPPLPAQVAVTCEIDNLAPGLPSRPVLAHHLGRGRYVTLSRFMGGWTFHVREYGVNGLTMRRYPTTRGVCLDHVQVRALIHHLEDIRARIHNSDIASEANWHLGKLTFAAFSPDFAAFVNLRHFFVPENENRLQATKRGITLNKNELDMLAVILTTRLENAWPALHQFNNPCFVQHSEHNDEERAKAQCAYCSPLLGL